MASNRYSIQVLERATMILKVLVDSSKGLTLDELALETGLHRATVYRIVMALRQENLIDRHETARYRLGILCIQLGAASLKGLTWADIAFSIMNEISMETRESVCLCVRSGCQMVNILTSPSPEGIQYYARVGEAFPLYAGEAGKLILAYLPETEVRLHLRESLDVLPRFPGTITDEDDLLRELESIRMNGYSISKMEVSDDEVGIATPIKNYDGSIIATISLVGPVNRMTDERLPDLISIMVFGARRISSNLGYVPEIT